MIDELTPEAFRWALRRLCCGVHGADARWAELAEQGATDAEILHQFAREVGEHCGGCGPGLPWYTAAGGTRPRVWITAGSHGPGQDPPTLQGPALAAAIRELFGIPRPEELLQLRLDLDAA